MLDKVIRAGMLAAAVLLTATACGGRGEGADTLGSGDCRGQQVTGITDTTIKLGGVYPLSGPASAYGEMPKGVRAYFDYVNAERGGVAGRQVEYLVRDDGYQPPKTVEETRRLVEQDRVFALFQTLGTPTSSAVWDYVGQQEVPHVFVAGGATKWGADTDHPWTIGWQPSYRAEGRAFAEYVRTHRPGATVAVLYQNDDFGKDLLDSFRESVRDSDIRIVAEQSYAVTDPTVDPQLRNLATSKADVLLNFSTPKFASQALAADARDPGWNPLHIVSMVANSRTVLEPVGFANVQGVVSAAFSKDPADPQWNDDPGMRLYKEKLAAYAPDADPADQYTSVGWAAAESFHKAMESATCPTREGLRDAVRNLSDVEIGLLQPGVTLRTGPGDGFPMEAMRIQRFEGDRWVLTGELIDTAE
ncbi:ABC transporter substrate-binding protein [Nocardia puris]|uniref:Amino acid/amide ABC transporter substrate-binding protein (HAAT family) n=1 Tax=Nocardia puris TaxID=208602 RepID=A0A366D645_9NOCA|nr:ABC transporter substrate-binding protein [Nocardia puris]MBF6212266.1 ABC transporter substrate-binding protein [Nocardia puris]MBF6366513.1 ABC transporter substrate-binding protein [Nocardia puris]MBF6460855.1 ABC transporter substrate-binding protein [Nocardia puris]RBO85500.1 amino acid/amide ABC transporter substrate-binding protein (HAAT family) [Nocardia puris]